VAESGGGAGLAEPFREVVVDLEAIRANVETLRGRIGTPHFMAVVKADAYGHGAVPSARAALRGGADWLGVADIAEALELRAAGIDAPVLAWLHRPDEHFTEAVEAGIDVGVSSLAQLNALAAAARSLGRRADAQIKLDTGLSRNGVPEASWREVLAAAAGFEGEGVVRVRGVFSHVSNASPDDDLAAFARFERGLALARGLRLRPEFVHIAATAAALELPALRGNCVRVGIGVYGLSPFADRSSAELGLTPAMTVRARVAAVRRVAADTGVSYDYTYRTDRETTLALVPLGYADGIPRHASGTAPVCVAGRTFTISGRVAMDQFVVDVGDHAVAVGDPVVLFGDPAKGVPSADDWARAAGTINYEIVTRMGGRAVRSHR
jgi:alanine racemase